MLQGYTTRDIRKAAEDMGYPHRLALWKRKQYLDAQLAAEQAEYWDNDTICAVTLHFCLENIRFIKAEILKIDKEMAALEAKKDEITDEMISRAKSTPIETIIEFKRGQAHCINPEHPDRNPSMFHGTRTNTAQCPACGYKADSITAYMVIWNCDFITAVKRLQH
jgi:hypothetical protein